MKKDSALILDGPADFTLTAAAYKRVIMTWELWSDAATPVKLFDYTATLIAPAMTAAQVAGGPQVSVWSENWIEEFYVRVNASDVTQVSVRGEHLSGPSYLGVPVFAWPGTVTRAPQ